MKTICLICKATDTRMHFRVDYIINKLSPLYNNGFLKNFVIIFKLKDILVITLLKVNITFAKNFGNNE